MMFRLTLAALNYKRAMTTNFHDMLQVSLEDYVDDFVGKSK